jgi:hypothetical protein
MLAEIVASPATTTAAIARYGLTREAKTAEDAAWQAALWRSRGCG